MHVLGVTNNYLSHETKNAGSGINHNQQKPIGLQSTNNPSSEVTISSVGQALAAETPEGLLKVALPGWMGTYLPQVSVLNNEDSNKVGYVAWEQQYRSEFKNEMREYGNLFSSAYEEAKAEMGVITQEDMYEKVIKNSEFSETLRQSVDEKLRANPRTLELMNVLGIRRA